MKMCTKWAFTWCLVMSIGADIVCGQFKIGAFNIQIFGVTKMGKPEVVDTLVKVVREYDILLIQEIRDASGDAIQELLQEVNEGDQQYKLEISDRLGRTSSKEQYAYVYRDIPELSIKATYQYPDPEDVFERPPFAVHFQSSKTDVSDFVLVGIHISPETAFEEINGLRTVHNEIQSMWATDDILLMGDFNADCSYLSDVKQSELLINTPEYKWWITDVMDTTVSASACTYDRFVMTGTKFIASVIPESAGVFHFDAEYGLTNEEAKKVSDHYPIELQLKQHVGATISPSSSPSPINSATSLHDGLLQNVVKMFIKLML